ncbi:MAG: transposase [Pirellulales bacterium]
MKGKTSSGTGGEGKRKRWSAAEKLRIVLAGMEPGVEISDLCRREGLNPTMYYSWKRQLLGAADRIFDRQDSKVSARESRLESANRRMKDVIAEITAENLELKKTLLD